MLDCDLSIIVPVYNEIATIRTVLDAISAAPFRKQVIVVDDGSTDGTYAAVQAWIEANESGAELVRHPINRGKGAAIRTGLARSHGTVVIVQDADLEYDPADYPGLIGPVLAGEAEAVYGSRYLGPAACRTWSINRVGVKLLNFLVLSLYGTRLTDEATGYKAFRTDLLRRMDLRCVRFEFCPEVTAKACRMGVALREVPIRYRPRTISQGKKIRCWDGLEAILTLLRWRLTPFRPGRPIRIPGYEPGRGPRVEPRGPDRTGPGCDAIELSVVIPAFDEAGRLPAYLVNVRAHLDRVLPDAYEVIVVDDGSRDGTAARLEAIAPSWTRLVVLRHAANRGKGAAVRTGMMAARGRLALFTDADGATPIAEEAKLRHAIDVGADVAVASRLLSGSAAVRRSRVRGLYGRAFARLARAVVGIPVRDTQCGFKMFRGQVARRLFGACREEGYLFDLHILGLASRLGHSIVEIPIPWREVPGSKIRPLRDASRMLFGLVRLGRALNRLEAADPGGSRRTEGDGSPMGVGSR